jgi:hypothetical protein
MAFGCPEDKLEALRDEIVKRYGEGLELLADENPPSKRGMRARKRYQ